MKKTLLLIFLSIILSGCFLSKNQESNNKNNFGIGNESIDGGGNGAPTIQKSGR